MNLIILILVSLHYRSNIFYCVQRNGRGWNRCYESRMQSFLSSVRLLECGWVQVRGQWGTDLIYVTMDGIVSSSFGVMAETWASPRHQRFLCALTTLFSRQLLWLLRSSIFFNTNFFILFFLIGNCLNAQQEENSYVS